jgi:diaminopimelate epimerase
MEDWLGGDSCFDHARIGRGTDMDETQQFISMSCQGSFLLKRVDVVDMGRMIRFHQPYTPAAANANFVKVEKSSRLSVRTYEREVEDETLACEKGAVASTLVAAFKRL